MKQYAKILLLAALSPMSWAQDPVPPLTLDKVSFQISSKQWVTTQTALLNVAINVNLNNVDLVKARAEVMASLSKIASGEWHLLEFDRSQDNSGLEKLYVQAQARVNQTALTDIYKNAKSVSKPGANYEVTSVEFKPSLEEVQNIKGKIREQLYQQVNDELTRLNKSYPAQNYSLSQLVFVEGENSLPKTFENKQMNVAMMAAAPAPLAVSNELILTAIVEAASNRKQGT